MKDGSYFVAAISNNSVGIVREDGNRRVISTCEAQNLAQRGELRGWIDGLPVPCLRHGKKCFPEYYRIGRTVFKFFYKQDKYHRIDVRRRLPMCDILCDSYFILVISDNDASVTKLKCIREGYTGLYFDMVIWQHKLFILAQTTKMLSDGMYFIYNEAFVLNADYSLYRLYESDSAEIERLERKWLSVAEFSAAEQDKLQEFQALEMNVRKDGVYLSEFKIYEEV